MGVLEKSCNTFKGQWIQYMLAQCAGSSVGARFIQTVCTVSTAAVSSAAQWAGCAAHASGAEAAASRAATVANRARMREGERASTL